MKGKRWSCFCVW